MGRGLIATAAVAVLGGLLAVSGSAGPVSAGAPSTAAFRLADGSAGCAFDGALLTCRAARDRTAVVMDAEGRTQAEDVDFEWNATTTVLRSSERWLHGMFSCRVAHREIVCSTLSGGLLVAGARRIAGSAPPVTFTAP
jgi:hypothetical protein